MTKIAVRTRREERTRLASLTFGRLVHRFGSVTLLGVTYRAMGAGLAGVGLVSSYAGVLVAIAIGGVGMGLMMPNLSQWTVRVASPAHRATAIGVVVVGVFLGQFASPLVSHPLVAALEKPATFLCLGAFAGLLGALVLLRGVAQDQGVGTLSEAGLSAEASSPPPTLTPSSSQRGEAIRGARGD